MILELSSISRNRNDNPTVNNVVSSFVRDLVKLDVNDKSTAKDVTSTTQATLPTTIKNEEGKLNSSSLGRFITHEKLDNRFRK